MNYPRITIITPSYNQGQYLEQTINSVLDQGYPNLEYIIIDGGSSDNSVSIINKYQKYLHYWISEPDKGQSDAINKGLKIATGDVVNWLNSDDYYMPSALKHVGEIFSDKRISAYCGKSRIFSPVSEYRSQGTDIYPGNLAKTIGWARIDQPETFFHKRVWDTLGCLNSSFHYVMDKEFWVRYLFHFGLESVVKDDEVLVNFRIHEQSKTGSQGQKFNEETYDLFFSLAKKEGIQDADKLSLVCAPNYKLLEGYNSANRELLINALHYFLLKMVLENYAQNNYPLARKHARLIDSNYLLKEDIVELNKVLFRMKVLPPVLKKLLNKIGS